MATRKEFPTTATLAGRDATLKHAVPNSPTPSHRAAFQTFIAIGAAAFLDLPVFARIDQLVKITATRAGSRWRARSRRPCCQSCIQLPGPGRWPRMALYG